MDHLTNLYNFDENFNLTLIKRLLTDNELLFYGTDCDYYPSIVDDNICIFDDKNCINVINLITFK